MPAYMHTFTARHMWWRELCANIYAGQGKRQIWRISAFHQTNDHLTPLRQFVRHIAIFAVVNYIQLQCTMPDLPADLRNPTKPNTIKKAHV